MSENSFIQIQTTTDSCKEAEKITQTLLENKLAACVKIISNVSSNYTWNGKVECTDEFILLINTIKDNYRKVEDTIKEIHHYETPEIIVIKIKYGSNDYLKWIENSIN